MAIKRKKHSKVYYVFYKIYRVCVAVFKSILLTVPFLFVISYTNYTVDPARLYHTEREDIFEYDIVRIMLEGKNVEYLSNYNERLTKRDYISRMPEAKDYIIAGSSRSALISKEMLGVDSLFNLSVAGAQFQDLIGLYGLLHQDNKLPKTLLLVMDPWMLNDNYGDKRYTWSVGDGYYYYLTERMGYEADPALVTGIDPRYLPGTTESIALTELNYDLQLNLLSITYFQASIQRYFDQSNHDKPDGPQPTDDYLGDGGLLRSDGSFSYPKDYRNLTVEQASHEARMSLPDNIIGLEDYSEQDSFLRQLCIDFIQCVQGDGVAVEMFIMPISPILFEYMQQFPDHYKNYFEAEDLFYTIAEESGIRIVGSFDPNTENLDMSSFYDGYHVKVNVIEELIKPLKLV